MTDAGKYRLIEIDLGCYAPAIKKPGHWFWRQIDDSGREMPLGRRWSGPFGVALKGIERHFVSELIG